MKLARALWLTTTNHCLNRAHVCHCLHRQYVNVMRCVSVNKIISAVDKLGQRDRRQFADAIFVTGRWTPEFRPLAK